MASGCTCSTRQIPWCGPCALAWLPTSGLAGWLAALRCHGSVAHDGRTGAGRRDPPADPGPRRPAPALGSGRSRRVDRRCWRPSDLTQWPGRPRHHRDRAVFDVMCRAGARGRGRRGDAAFGARRVTSGPEVGWRTSMSSTACSTAFRRLACSGRPEPASQSCPESPAAYGRVALAGLPEPEVNRGLPADRATRGRAGSPGTRRRPRGRVRRLVPPVAGPADGRQRSRGGARAAQPHRVRATAVDLWTQRHGRCSGSSTATPAARRDRLGTAGGCRFGERDDDHLGRLGGFREVGTARRRT